MHAIKWDEKALEEISKLEKSVAIRIYKKIEVLKENPSSCDIKKLKGTETSRLRVGDYRVIFSIENQSIIIWKVGHRKNIYEEL